MQPMIKFLIDGVEFAAYSVSADAAEGALQFLSLTNDAKEPEHYGITLRNVNMSIQGFSEKIQSLITAMRGSKEISYDLIDNSGNAIKHVTAGNITSVLGMGDVTTDANGTKQQSFIEFVTIYDKA